MKAKMKNAEVWIATEKVVTVQPADVQELRKLLQANQRKRIRLCTHKETDDKLQEMFIVVGKESYIRPHKHRRREESFHIIEGRVDVLLFDDAGALSQVIHMGDFASGLPFYYRLTESVFHTLIIRSDVLVFHESTTGPFDPADTVYAPWSPEDSDAAGIREFRRRWEQEAR